MAEAVILELYTQSMVEVVGESMVLVKVAAAMVASDTKEVEVD